MENATPCQLTDNVIIFPRILTTIVFNGEDGRDC